MKTELYINNKLADISDQTIIAITKTYEKQENPLNYYCDFSKTVSLPLSKANNDIFSNFHRLDSLVTNQSIDPARKLPFVLLNNKELVMKGYLHLDNANTVLNDNHYEVTLYSTFGDIINELKQLTFNPNADVESKYKIATPFTNTTINRNIVKRSFEQQSHLLESEDIIDWIGFIPTYQGKYSDFSSDKIQTLANGHTNDLSRERDEHYMREFRSYQQQPFFWVDKLWKCAKDKVESITDYTMNLDKSWFSVNNPYYKDLIYTCPTLMNSDDNYKEYSEVFTPAVNSLTYSVTDQSALTNSPRVNTGYGLFFDNLTRQSGDTMYSNGVFNPNSNYGSTVFKGRLRLTLYAAQDPQTITTYGKIHPDNPFYVTVKAVYATGGRATIPGAKRTFLLYSNDHNATTTSYDEAIDLGVTSRTNPSVHLNVGNREILNGTYAGNRHNEVDGYFWDTNIEFALNVTQNVPYKIEIDIHNNNIHKPFETAVINWLPGWDSAWTDLFYTGNALGGDKGYSFYADVVRAEVVTMENVRSYSPLNFYRVFPKDSSLLDVLLNYSKMFGLVWTVDEDRKELTVMTRNRFFTDSEIWDWTEKIDRSKDFKFNPLTFDKKYVEFNFEEGKCHRLQGYEAKYEYTYGTKKLDTGYEFNSEENKLFKGLQPSVVSQKKQYSMKYNTEYEDMPNFMGYSYMVYPNEHFVDNDNKGENAGMSGAFYFRNGRFQPDERLGMTAADSGQPIVRITDDTSYQIQTQEFCWDLSGDAQVLCYYLPDVGTISNLYNGKRYSVHFASPKEYYYKQPGGTVGYIYDTRWGKYIDERYCSQNKTLTAYVYITPDEFAAINFRQFVKIDNILYAIDKVYDYNFNASEPVKVDLVQVWDMSAYVTGQDEMPYLFPAEETKVIGTTATNITIYASGAFTVTSKPDWVACTTGTNLLTVTASGLTNHYREGTITLQLTSNTNITCNLTVQQQAIPCHLTVSPRTLVFNAQGGTTTAEIDSSSLDLSDVPIGLQITGGNGWLMAEIYENTGAFSSARSAAGQYQLLVTAAPNPTTNPRNGYIELGMMCGGTLYKDRVNVGQQANNSFSREEERDLSELTIYNSNNQTVAYNQLIAGQTYHFTDYFAEQIIPESIHITNGDPDITISGIAGYLTITFTPLLSNVDLTDPNPIGGGKITLQTVNGKGICYNYMVNPSIVPIYTRTLQVSANNFDYGSFSINNSRAYTRPYSGQMPDGTSVTIEALPSSGHTFQNWTVVGASLIGNPNPLTLIVSNDTEVIANFDNQVTITFTLTVNPGANGQVKFGDTSYTNQTITRTVTAGTTITGVQASPNAGYYFYGWSDNTNTNPVDILMNSNKSITAFWAANANISAGTGGTVSVNGQTGNYNQNVQVGTSLIITATPSSGYQFDGWSDGVLTATRTETINNQLTLTAAFIQSSASQYNITLYGDNTIGTGLGSPSDELECALSGQTPLTTNGGSYNDADFDEDTYDITLSLPRYDTSTQVFNSWIVEDGNTTSYYDETTVLRSYYLDKNLKIGVTVNKYGFYYGWGDYATNNPNVLDDQDLLLDSNTFTYNAIDPNNLVLEFRTNRDKRELTVCIPKEYKVLSIEVSPDQRTYNQIPLDISNRQTVNGLWLVTYVADVDPGSNRYVRIKFQRTP